MGVMTVGSQLSCLLTQSQTGGSKHIKDVLTRSKRKFTYATAAIFTSVFYSLHCLSECGQQSKGFRPSFN